MRKLILFCCVFLLLSKLNASDFVTIASPGAGQLQLTDEALMASKLRVTGHIDARDFETLKTVTINRTRVLDLSDAVIDAYSGTGCYVDISSDIFVGNTPTFDYLANVLPNHAFVEGRDNSLKKWRAGSATLRELILPKTLVDISPEAFIDCNMLSKLYTLSGSELLSEDNAVVYTKDKKRLLRVAPAYSGGIDLPASITAVDSCAFKDVFLSYIAFNSVKMPVIKNSSLINAAYLISNVEDCNLLFPSVDCVEEIKVIYVDEVTEGGLLEAIGNKGYKRNEVRSVVVSGVLNDSDIKALFALPNLHYADLSKARTTTNKIVLSNTKLCEVKLPSGGYALYMENNKYLSGSLNIPEGVYYIYYEENGYESVTFPSTLQSIGNGSFNGSIIRRADFSACTKLTSIESCFSYCANLEDLLLPPSLELLAGVTYSPIKSIKLPNSLKRWKNSSGWDIDLVVLPESLLEIDGVYGMACLKNIDAVNAVNLKTVEAFSKCPFIETVNFANSPIERLEGFEGKENKVSKEYVVVVGGTAHPAPFISNRLKNVVLPSTLKTFNAFNNCPLLTDMKLDHCYRLTSLSGLENCTTLSSLSIPAELSDFDLTLKGCDNLRTIRTTALTPPVVSTSLDTTVMSQVTLYVPSGKVGIYGMSDGWSDCKEIKADGYTVQIAGIGNDMSVLADGCGLYEKGAKVTLTASPYSVNALQQAYCIGWYINDEYVQGKTVAFTIKENCTVIPVFGCSAPDWSKADIMFEFQAQTDTVNELMLATYTGGDIEIYSENGCIYKSTEGQNSTIDFTLSLNAGTQKFAIVGGNVFYVNLNPSFNSENTNVLKNIVFKDKEKIEQLYLTYLSLDNIDLSGCSALQYLELSSLNIKNIDLSGCSRLEGLYISDNELETLNLTDCSSLVYLYGSNNALKEIDLSNCSKIQKCYLGTNNLESIDVSGCHLIEDLSLCDNNLETIDLSDCDSLVYLDLYNNNLNVVDLSACSKLTFLRLAYNKLKNIQSLDKCKNLEYLNVYDNELTTLNVTSDKLTYFEWENNPMAFSVLTPELYEKLKDEWEGYDSDKLFKVSSDMVDENGILDFTNELYATDYSKDTKIEIKQGKVTEQSEGKFLLQDYPYVFYVFSLTNSNFPALTFETSFTLNQLTGIAAMNIDKLDILIGEENITLRGMDDGMEVELISLSGMVLQNAISVQGEAVLSIPDSEKICLLRIKKGDLSQTFKVRVN